MRAKLLRFSQSKSVSFTTIWPTSFSFCAWLARTLAWTSNTPNRRIFHVFTNRLSVFSVHPCFSSAGQAMEHLGKISLAPGKVPLMVCYTEGDIKNARVHSTYRKKYDSKQNDRLTPQRTRELIKPVTVQRWLLTCLNPSVFVSHICFIFQKKGCSHFWQESLSNHWGAWGRRKSKPPLERLIFY